MQYIQEYIALFTENAILYFVVVLPFFAGFWMLGKQYFAFLRIQPNRKAKIRHLKHDLTYSVSTIVLVAGFDLIIVALEKMGCQPIYYQVDAYGWGWLFCSAALLLFLDDTYVYWVHRAMHHPKIYRFVHKVHHQSVDPSPFTMLAFHPSEALIQNIPYYVLPFLLPVHSSVILFWQLFGITNNLFAHLGYEMYPKAWTKLFLLKYKTTSTHHNMHHERFRGNYAVYFTWWDKLMGTEFPDYEQRHAAIFERKGE